MQLRLAPASIAARFRSPPRPPAGCRSEYIPAGQSYPLTGVYPPVSGLQRRPMIGVSLVGPIPHERAQESLVDAGGRCSQHRKSGSHGLTAGGSRIRTLGPALHTHRFGPPSCRPRDGPVRQTEITRWRPGTKRSTPASAAEYTATAWGLSAGALPGWRDLHPSAYGHAAGEVVRARAITAMVLRSRLQNHVEGRLRRAPDALEAAPPRLPREPVPRQHRER